MANVCVPFRLRVIVSRFPTLIVAMSIVTMRVIQESLLP